MKENIEIKIEIKRGEFTGYDVDIKLPRIDGRGGFYSSNKILCFTESQTIEWIKKEIGSILPNQLIDLNTEKDSDRIENEEHQQESLF